MHGPRHEGSAVLQQILADLVACSREVVEAVEVQPRHDRDDDAAIRTVSDLVCSSLMVFLITEPDSTGTGETGV